MTATSPVQAFTGVTEAALALGHRTYAGTVASTNGSDSAVSSFASVSAAALALGHRTYAGTVASTERRP
jgi:hypothetical protein